MIATDRPNDGVVQSILMTIQFTALITPPPPITVTVPPTTCDKVQYVANMTIPDGTIMQPGAQFTKTWRLKNIGTCAWKKDTYQLVYVSGSTMGSTSAVFPQDIPVGQDYDFSINLVAPSEAGSYRGYWMFKNASGVLFGVGAQGNKPWWIDIKVADPSFTTYEAIMADNGKTFVMKVGDKLKINLDYSYVWSTTTISNPAVIVGAQDGYFALASGSATLSITGDPECLSLTPPCGMPSILYSITVIVQ